MTGPRCRYYRRALRLSQQVPNDTALDVYAYGAGRCYLNLSRLDSAIVLLRQSVQAAWLTHDTMQATRSANVVVDVYSRQGLPDSVRAVVRRLRALYPHTRPGTIARNNLDNTLAAIARTKASMPKPCATAWPSWPFAAPSTTPAKPASCWATSASYFTCKASFGSRSPTALRPARPGAALTAPGAVCCPNSTP